MISRRYLAFALLAAATFASSAGPSVGTAYAADEKPFTAAAFEAAKSAGRPILVEVTAPWCPTCKAQKPILAKLTAEPRFADLAIFQVDFDSEKEVLRALGVRMQSTLISYKNGREVGRSTGLTDEAGIAAQLGKSI